MPIALDNQGLTDELAIIREAARTAPGEGDLRFMLAEELASQGHRAEAIEELRHAIVLGASVELFDRLARLEMPGPDYRAHMAALHGRLSPRVYLEIGVFGGDTLALARPPTIALGVDPEPLPRAGRPYAAATRISRLRSDDFFAALDGGRIALPGSIDFAFIDGLHLFEQVLRDFINVERRCHTGSVVMFHDTLPVAALPTARTRRTSHWCGDVWRIVPCLRRYRPDLTLASVPAYPSGLTLVTGLDPSSSVLVEAYEAAVAEFGALDLGQYDRRRLANDLELVGGLVAERCKGAKAGAEF